MPVDSKHPEYKKQVERVLKVRDCFDGSDAVKERGDAYLPMLDAQTKDEYEAYKTRGLFLPAVAPTLTAFVGAIMRKSPVVEMPQALEYMLTDTNGEGRDLDLLASLIIKELNLSGRSCILVEHNGERPILLTYAYESVINWSEDYIILEQSYLEPSDDDPYELESKMEYLELTYDENGYYIQNLWRYKNKKLELYDTFTPTKRGERLDYIPFSVANTMELGWRQTDPALIEIADVNLDHYRLSTDLRHGLHYTALPTMFLFGEMRDEDGNPVTIKVGAGSANQISDTDARAELLEFTGAGLSSIDKAINEDVVMMASIGAKMLQNPSTGVKAAETARIEASGESATLSTMANACEAQLNQVLTWCADWESLAGDIDVKLNRDFLDTKLDPTMLTALLQTYQAGGISLDTFLNNLSKGEILPQNRTIEEEMELIAEGDANTLNLDDPMPEPTFE